MVNSIEICNHCGKDVAVGKSGFINRIPDLNSIDTRAANGLKYPMGDLFVINVIAKIAILGNH